MDGGQRSRAQRVKGLLVDFGGVLTTNVFASFREFSVSEGLGPDAIKVLFRDEPEALRLVRGLETAAVTEDEFGIASASCSASRTEPGWWSGCSPASGPTRRCSRRCARCARAGFRTGLISNSMGAGRYDRDEFPRLFDGVVISGDVGMHKPQPEIFLLGCERVGLEPSECVFVDDLKENCTGAEAVGMTAVLHRGADTTVPQLERLFGLELAA